jgi:hypothetical protein
MDKMAQAEAEEFAQWAFHANLEILNQPEPMASIGAMPSDLACQFTRAELDVLAIVAIDVYQRGHCNRKVAEIADLAMVCRATAHGAIQAAKQLGLIEKRQDGGMNMITIISPEWAAWLDENKSR